MLLRSHTFSYFFSLTWLIPFLLTDISFAYWYIHDSSFADWYFPFTYQYVPDRH